MSSGSMDATTHDLPERAEVLIDVPLGGFIKRDDAGRFDYISPFPCPFNYGSVPGTVAPDGDRIDAVVFGDKLAAGTRVTLPVRGIVDFVDAGREDPKWICSPEPLTERQQRIVTLFFVSYGPMKSALNLVRGAFGRTTCRGVRLVR